MAKWTKTPNGAKGRFARAVAVGLLAGALLSPAAAASCYVPVSRGPSVAQPYQSILNAVYSTQYAASQGNYLNAYSFSQQALSLATKLSGTEAPWVVTQTAYLAASVRPTGFTVSQADYLNRENSAWFALTSYYKNEAK